MSSYDTMDFNWLIQHHALRAEFNKRQAQRAESAKDAARHTRAHDMHREAVVFLLAQELIVKAYYELTANSEVR